MNEIGKKLNDRYKIVGNIGNGGMANVFLAQDLILNRQVAVKVLRFDFQNDQDAIRRFQREALAATELVHPNVVSVYDVGEEDGMQYIVMEYVKGMDLKSYIKRYYPLPYRKVIDIMEQILSAIALAHRHRIIHRDLKPQNILINEEGQVKITDFGIAIALSETSITQTNSMLGSVHYLSPEQARGGMATKQSDIYALGIILYEMLCGQVPFDGESAVSIALKHFQNPLPSIKEIDPSIPQALENVVLHATAKEPYDRYESVEEMLQDLSTTLDPRRKGEPAFKPKGVNGDTVILGPIPKETPMPSSFNEMKVEPKEEEIPPVSPVSSNSFEQTNKNKKNKKFWMILSALAVVLVGVIVATFYFTAPEDVKVPDVTDLTLAEATSLLEEKNLKVNPTPKEVSDEKIKKGSVVKTDPEKGATVKEKRVVTLYVSKGPGDILFPDLSDATLDEAKETLEKLGFDVSKIKVKEQFSSEVEKDKIIKQTPKENKKVSLEEDITLTVSKGPELKAMISVIGKSQARGTSELENLGIPKENISTSEVVSSEAPGTIIQQSIAAGEKVEVKKAMISLTIAKKEEIVLIDLPSFKTKEEALNFFNNEGSALSYTFEEVNSEAPVGSVINMNPGGGSRIDPNKVTVTITISKGPKEDVKPPEVSTTESQAQPQAPVTSSTEEKAGETPVEKGNDNAKKSTTTKKDTNKKIES